jgi:molecular chaperone GrpE
MDPRIESGLRCADTGEEEEASFRVVDRRRRHEEESGETEAAESREQYPAYVEELRGRAEAAEEKLREYIAAFREERESLERLRKRLEERAEERAREAVGRGFGRFLEVAELLERALDHAPPEDPLREGVERTHRMLLDLLEEQGLESLSPLGEAFDPHEAEAVLTRECGEEDHGKVLEVLRPGFRWDEKVLRAAQVVVGRHEAPG